MPLDTCRNKTKRPPRKRTAIVLSAGLLVASWGIWGPSVQAEILYEEDGVQLRGTARIITYNAAICRVSKENYTAERYEEMKPNDGQPLHVW